MVAAPSFPDCILTRGIVLHQDPARPQAQALAISAGRIQAVGTDDDIAGLAGPGTRRVDLGGRTVIPGFNDAHVHVWKVGHLLTSMLDLRAADGITALQAALRARSGEDGWLQGRGWNEARFREGRMPTRHDLDAAAPDRPVFLTRTCGHIAVASSRALALAGVTAATAPPPGGAIGREADGAPSGILQETAMGLVAGRIPAPSAAEYEAMIRAAARHQLALGITSATEAGAAPDLLAVYHAMDARGALPYRVNVMALRRPLGSPEVYPLPARHVSDFLRVDSIKLFADGGLSGGTAALGVPYRDGSGSGLLRLSADEFCALAADAHAAGLRVGVHAIGDAAIDAVLDGFERLQPARAGHRIEHCGLPTAHHLERARALGLVVVPQPIFIHALGVNFRRLLRDDFLDRVYPVRAMLEAGLAVAFSSDAPVVADDNPLLGMQAAVNRRDETGAPLGPLEAVSAADALRAYTTGGALASGDVDNRGLLAPGRWADLAVLSENPLTCAPERLAELRVDATMVAGRMQYER